MEGGGGRREPPEGLKSCLVKVTEERCEGPDRAGKKRYWVLRKGLFSQYKELGEVIFVPLPVRNLTPKRDLRRD